MEAIGKIGVIIPEVLEVIDREMIQGIHTHAKELGYDVLIFTDACNKTDEYQIYPDVGSFCNIYQLAFHSELDGILFHASRYLSRERKKEIYAELRKFPIPCLSVGEQTDLLPYVTASQTESMYQLTKHLIEAHHCRKLYCLTGFPDEFNSDERIAGFCQAMAEADLPVDDSMIFYGGFWKEKPRQLGADIAEGRVPKPDAIVCASDTMAFPLCEALRQHGVAVPEDIAVTGYDGSLHTAVSLPNITTVCGRERQLGFNAVCRLHELITGKQSASAIPQQYIRFGTSCGCSPLQKNADQNTQMFLFNLLQQWYDQNVYRPINIISVLSTAEELDELMNTVYAISFLLHPVYEYAVCLCEDWKFDFENTASFRKQGYSETMQLALRYTSDGAEKEITFPRKKLLPELAKPHEPQLIVFTSLHQDVQIFGYVAHKYKDALQISLDEHLMNWNNALANGLDKLQKRMYEQYIRKQLTALSVHDPSTGLFNKRGFLEQLSKYSGKQDYLLLLISYPERQEHESAAFLARHTWIANALRLSAPTDEVIARLDEHVFAVLSYADTREEPKRFADRHITLLEAKMREIMGMVPYQQFPELLTDCSKQRFRKLSEAEELIEERLQLLQARTEALTDASGNYMDKLYRMHREIWSAPQKEWSLPEMAERIGISTSHFQKIYKKEYGISCNKDIIHARIEKAKWLLRHTELRVQEISVSCGYHDNSHFMRQFKERVGMSALQYRETGEDA